MEISTWLTDAVNTLEETGVATARLDCLVLLEDATMKDRAWLLSHDEYKLQEKELNILNTQIAKRAKHMPLAYIRGKAEFYGREFLTTAHTLVPRPESETLIDLLKVVRNREADVAVWESSERKLKSKQRRYPFEKSKPESSLLRTDEGYKVVWPIIKAKSPQKNIKRPVLAYRDSDLFIADIGTGSGALAITAKLELPEATVVATDIDKQCLKIANENAKRLGAEIIYMQGNLLEPLVLPAHKLVILVCNLPYVPDNFQINTAATHEPRHALFGGSDGLDLYRTLFEQVNTQGEKPNYILTESLPPQHKTLSAIAENAGYALARSDDFIQVFEFS